MGTHKVKSFQRDPQQKRSLELAQFLMQGSLLLDPIDTSDPMMLSVSKKNGNIINSSGKFQLEKCSADTQGLGIKHDSMVLLHRKLFFWQLLLHCLFSLMPHLFLHGKFHLQVEEGKKKKKPQTFINGSALYSWNQQVVAFCSTTVLFRNVLEK